MDELDPAYLALYWPLIGGTPPSQENTMRCSIHLEDEHHQLVDEIREGLDRAASDPKVDRLMVAHMRSQCRTLDGVVRLALATTADEIQRVYPKEARS